MKAVPVITEEVVQSLEETIKKRILDVSCFGFSFMKGLILMNRFTE